MKKVISILLTIAIMCSFTMFAFASDIEVKLDTSHTYTVSQGKTTDLTFVPNETAIYKIDFEFKDIQTVKNSTPALTMYYKSEEFNYTSLLKFSSDVIKYYEYEENFSYLKDSLTFVGEKNKPYTIELSNEDLWCIKNEGSFEIDKTVDVTLKITNANAQELKFGNTYKQNDTSAVYYMQPEKDIICNITSSNDNMDLYIYNNANRWYDSFSVYKEAFNYTFKLEGGNFYEIEILSSDETKVPFSFTIKDGSNVLPKEIYSYAEDIYMVKDGIQYIGICTYPYGSEVNSEGFEVTVANEKIAKVEIDEDGDYAISGLRAGKTTYTVKEKTTGISATYNIKVVSKTANFIASIPDNISSFFMSVFYTILDYLGIEIYC